MDIDRICRKYCESIDVYLTTYLQGIDKAAYPLLDSIKYSLLSGGKRIRPILVLSFFKLFSGDLKNAYPYAMAVEMIHTYSLIHDDLPCMDNDKTRRGKPCNHIVYGEDIALLAGDALITQAFEIALQSENAKSIGIERALRALKILAESSGTQGMVSGQVFDIKMNENKVCRETILNMYNLKTSKLISASSKMGAVLAGAGEAEITAAEKYGEFLGLSFQIVDDILDVIGDEKITGKTQGSDKTNGKSTYVSLYGIDKSRNTVSDLTQKAIEELKIFKGDTTFLKEFAESLVLRAN